jgi:FkbM family methyltransferase
MQTEEPLSDCGSFISYSQNLEDVMLWRALGHVKDGFYVDVGANDPVFDSVTKAFYDRGWSGLNLEPCQSVFQRLEDLRVKDINLRQLAGSSRSSQKFFEFDDTGRSTMDEKAANQYRAEGHAFVESSLPVAALDEILEQYVDQAIHFLKIDVEGAEKIVLEGASFEKHRPWVLLIESTVPGEPLHNHDEWEHLVVTKGYEFVYDDGLNRFYLANEHRELKSHFKFPPNFFDGYVKSSEVAWRNRAHEVTEQYELLRDEYRKSLNKKKSLFRKLKDYLKS